MKKLISAVIAFTLAACIASPAVFADEIFKITAESVYATPVVNVTMPKSMAFIFNPYDIKITEKGSVDPYKNNQKIVCSYEEQDGDAWVITNHSGVPIRAGVYAWAEKNVTTEFTVCDAYKNNIDRSDDTKKFLLLDIEANGERVTLLDERLRTDEEEPQKLNIKAGWWSEENNGVITILNGIEDNGTIDITISGDTVNAGDLTWKKSDKVTIGFVFNFEVEDPT